MSKFFLNLEKPDRGGHQWKSTEKLKSSLKKLSLWSVFVFGFLFFSLFQNSNLLFADVTQVAEREEIGYLKYNLYSETEGSITKYTATVVGYKSIPDNGAITIPDKVSYGNKDYTVTKIGNRAFFSCDKLTSVTFPASLESIDNYAFYFSGLTSVDLSKCKSLTSIGESAFYGCSGLKSVNLEGCTSLKSIGKNAFIYCSGLKSVNLSGCTKLTSIGDSAFQASWDSEQGTSTSKLTSVNLEGCTSLTSIGGGAFKYCDKLTSVTFPASLTSIGSQAFYRCSGLTSVTFPASLKSIEGLTNIGSLAFAECSGLTSVTFLASLTSIGSQAFYRSANVKRVTILDDGKTNISSHFPSYKKVTFTYFDGNNPTVVMVQYVKSNSKGNSIKNPSEYNDQFEKSYSSYWRLPNSFEQFVFEGTTPVNDDLELIDAPAVVFSAGGGTFVFGSNDTLSDYEFLSNGNKTFLTYAYRTESGDNAPAYLINKVPGDALVYKGYEYSGWNLGETVYSGYNDVCNAFSAAYKSSPVTFTAAFEAIKYTIEYYSKQDDSYKLIKTGTGTATETVTVEHSVTVNSQNLSGFLYWCVLNSENNLVDVDTITIDADSTISYDDLAENGTYSTYLVSGQSEGQPPILKLGAVVQEYETAEIQFAKEFAGDYGKFVEAVNSALDSATSNLDDNNKKNAKKQEIMKNLFFQLFSVSENNIDLTQSTNLSDELKEADLNYYDITSYLINSQIPGKPENSSIVFTIQVVKKVGVARTITIKEKDGVFSGVYNPESASESVEVL